MSKYGFNYRVDVLFFTRSYDGDDWDTRTNTYYFDSLDESKVKAIWPYANTKGLIESCVYDVSDSMSGNLLWKKDWQENKIVDYTTIPDFDYHNREYDD